MVYGFSISPCNIKDMSEKESSLNGKCGGKEVDYDLSAIIPQLEKDSITVSDLNVATRVLQAVGKLHPKFRKKRRRQDNINSENEEDGLKLYQQANLRPLRKALASVFELHKLQMYEGKSEEDYYAHRIQERTIKRQKMAERDQQKKYLADTELRRGRIEKLEKLKMEGKQDEEDKLRVQQQMLMIPDGHVETGEACSQTKLLEDDKKDEQVGNVQLPKLRSCYVCKVRFRDLHRFYDQLCPSCAKLNFEKRHFSVSLEGKVAIVTGSRVKIGYQTCLKLLRAKCTVVATTRFPNSAAMTYRSESDFDQWKNRLHIYGLDLRDVIGLEAFTRFLKIKFGESGIDVLINNACQTIRRPTAYYLPIVKKETSIWTNSDDTHKDLLRGCLEFEQIRRKILTEQKGTDEPTQLSLQSPIKMNSAQSSLKEEVSERKKNDDSAITSSIPKEKVAPFECTGLSHSSAMSQMVILPDDVGVDPSILPPGLSDINGQQLDLRKTNSWLLKMNEISTPEVMECMFINAIAPFVLNSRLQPLMTNPANLRPDRYIINVSAMEGKFYRYKMPNHPHTNMAKAALNMLTRTSSEELAKNHRIFMNSVDTGWINDENPLERASKTAATNNFQTPIDEIDAAARILDPIFVGVEIDLKKKTVQKEYGKFFKDYRESDW